MSATDISQEKDIKNPIEEKSTITDDVTEEDSQTIVYVVPVIDTQHSTNPLSEAQKKTFRNLAIIQIILGILSIICGITALIICDADTSPCGGYCYVTDEGSWTNVAATIWGGVLVILCASFSLFQEDANAKCLLMSKLAFKVFAGMTTGTMLGLEITADIYSSGCETLLIIHSISASIAVILLIVYIIDIAYSVYVQCSCFQNENDKIKQVTLNQPESEIIPNPHIPHITLPSGHTIIIEETASTTSSGSPVSYRTERRGSNISVIYLPTIST